MIKREFVKLKGCKRVWHTVSNDGKTPSCRGDFNLEWNGRVLAVRVAEEHKPPRPFCKICLRALLPGEHLKYKWVENVRLYPSYNHH